MKYNINSGYHRTLRTRAQTLDVRSRFRYLQAQHHHNPELLYQEQQW